MSNNIRGLSSALTGMYTDLHPSNMKEGMYSYMLNGVVENFDGNGFPLVQNIQSNIKCNDFPEGYIVVGHINVIEQKRIVWFLYNPTTQKSQIGESLYMDSCYDLVKDGYLPGFCDDCESIKVSEANPLETVNQASCCQFFTVNESDCLNFSDKHPINSVEYLIEDCGLNIYFTDSVNPRRYLKFDYLNDDPSQRLIIDNDFLVITGFEDEPCEIPIYGTDIDCNKINIQPNLSTPCIEFVDLVPGGSNKAGVYQFLIAYADEKGNKLSSYVSSTNPIPIRTKEITFQTDYVTDRAIALKVNNIDIFGPYQHYNIVVAKTINRNTSFYLVGTFPITQTSYTYTGNDETEIKLTPGDIFQRIPYYKTANDVAISNGIMFWSGLTEFSKPNLQRVANDITLYWQTIAIPEAVYREARNTEKFRGYLRDEVYPFGIQFIYSNGQETSVYHIPNRESRPSDLEVINNNDVIEEDNCENTERNLRWQVYNTATILGGDLSIYKDCEETCYQYGEFAYWQSTERYPNIPEIWGDLCGQFIRHHKFPDSTITHIHNYENGTVAYKENNLVFPIGVKVDHESVNLAIQNAVTNNIISQEEADRIVGYRVVRGNRFRNKSIQAKGLLFDVNQYVRFDGAGPIDDEPIYFANYPYNDLNSNPFLTNQLDNYDNHNDPEGSDLAFTFSKRYTFHSPDTHFNEPGIGTELKLETSEYGNAEGYYTKSRGQAKQKLLSDSSYALALTGGIIAALLRTEEKECVEYTIKSNYIYNQENSSVSTDWDASGQSPYGNVSGTGVFELGTGTITITTVEAQGSWNGQGTADSDVTHGEVTQKNHDDSLENLTASQYTWDDATGNAGGPKDNTGALIDDKKVEQIVAKTCKGTRNQYFANPSLNGNVMSAVLGVLNSILGGVNKTADFIRVVLAEMNIILEVIKSLTPYRDWTVQYHSVGKYNNYVSVGNTGNKRRRILSWAYLKPENNFINEEVDSITGQFDSIKFNNWNRESSLYLKYDGVTLPTPNTVSGVIDRSRVPLNDPSTFNCNLEKRAYTPICSYYASLKSYVPDQYGSIYNIDYLSTGSCIFEIGLTNLDCRGVYGGDTFINRFGLKTKVPYFLVNTFRLPDGTDFNFSEYPNLAFPRHYYNSDLTLGSEIENILDILNPVNIIDNLGRPKSIRDCNTNKFFYQNGYIYLYHYGIPYFLVESDVNVDYRYAENNKEKSFYPLQGDLDFWLQEENVPITEDNYYFYNQDYSKQNRETPLLIDGPDFEPSRDCRVELPNRIIYATDSNWLTYKANDFEDLPISKGPITSIEGIENDSVLIRTTNSMFIFKSVLRTVIDGQTVQQGTGGLFSNPPQEFAQTTLGYVGSQHKAILHTEYGHVTVDAKRGQIFVIGSNGSSLDEISKNGMKNFFKNNLPFRILRDFPNLPIDHADNAYAGVGLILAFDKRYNQFYLTKRDYILKDKSVNYDPETREFYRLVNNVRIVVSLGDKRYFEDCSWTISYNFFLKTWISFYSFKPNYYIDFIDYFGSGLRNSFWLHNISNYSHQVFYGKLYPFIFEPIVNFSTELKTLNSVEFDTEVRRYNDEYDYRVKKKIPGVNKVVVYNDHYNSGLVNLETVDKNDLTKVGLYPIRNYDNWISELAISNYKWRFNQFFNLLKDDSEVLDWLYENNNADKNLNPLAFNYKKDDFTLSRIKGQWFKLRFINDVYSNYKIIHKFSDNNLTIQLR